MYTLGRAPRLTNTSSPSHLVTWQGGRHRPKSSSHFSHASCVLGTELGLLMVSHLPRPAVPTPPGHHGELGFSLLHSRLRFSEGFPEFMCWMNSGERV